MYQVGELIIHGSDGVCRVEKIGPLEMAGAPKGVDYYTLSPLYRSGTIFTPVDTEVYMRPVLTREEAEALIDRIPDIPEQASRTTNPRLLSEQYRASLKSGDCVELVRLIRGVYAKGRAAAKKGRHLGQVDERSLKQAADMLHGELAVALGMEVDQVEAYICRRVESAREERADSARSGREKPLRG